MKSAKLRQKALHDQASFACHFGHEIIIIIILLQGCLSYTPVESTSNIETICCQKQQLQGIIWSSLVLKLA